MTLSYVIQVYVIQILYATHSATESQMLQMLQFTSLLSAQIIFFFFFFWVDGLFSAGLKTLFNITDVGQQI